MINKAHVTFIFGFHLLSIKKEPVKSVNINRSAGWTVSTKISFY